MNILESQNNFRIWFVEPIAKLKELPDGAGGIVAFIVGLALYERLIKGQLKIQGKKTDPETVQNHMNIDLHLSDSERRIFWDIFRDGLLHQAMPKKGKAGYIFHHSFSGYPIFTKNNGQNIICIDPWKFTDRVIDEFLSNPELIHISESYPLPMILPK